jgi:hypothetical protein
MSRRNRKRVWDLLTTNQKNEFDAAPNGRRYLVRACTRVDDRVILLDRT